MPGRPAPAPRSVGFDSSRSRVAKRRSISDEGHVHSIIRYEALKRPAISRPRCSMLGQKHGLSMITEKPCSSIDGMSSQSAS